MKFSNFILGLLIGVALVIGFQPTNAAPIPETITVTETKTEYINVVEKEYIKVNQTEPVEMITTAYTNGPESTGKRPGDKGYGITFSGTKAGPGTCAVDEKVIPYGTSLYVEDYGYCVATDKGSAVNGLHVDVWTEHVSDALEFGRQQRKVWILSKFEEETNEN